MMVGLCKRTEWGALACSLKMKSTVISSLSDQGEDGALGHVNNLSGLLLGK